jgi:hypothetical protein
MARIFSPAWPQFIAASSVFSRRDGGTPSNHFSLLVVLGIYIIFRILLDLLALSPTPILYSQPISIIVFASIFRLTGHNVT